jgi:hypothetical protein
VYHSLGLASSNCDVTVRLFSSFFGEEMDVPRCRLEPDRGELLGIQACPNTFVNLPKYGRNEGRPCGLHRKGSKL